MTNTPGVLARLQRRWGEAVDGAIVAAVDDSGAEPGVVTMMLYQLGYVNSLGRQTRSRHGGKRFRPLICLLACSAAGGDWRDALTVAAAIELLHNFSLIHDDIEDHDPARRHRPTVWKVWGEPQATNAGDAMFALAGLQAALASTDPDVCLEIASRFQNTTLSLTEGQYLDMSFEVRLDVSPQEYLRMIAHKTGALIAFSAWSGGRIARADPARSEALYEFGAALGKAFQIQDDILGIWAPADVTGKEQAKDLRNRKKTLPVLLAAERAEPADVVRLKGYLSRESEDVDAVVHILSATGARDLCLAQLRHHLDVAREALDAARLDPDLLAELDDLAAEVTRQTS
jgi:geranylgeranyl diphosphate synthase type I